MERSNYNFRNTRNIFRSNATYGSLCINAGYAVLKRNESCMMVALYLFLQIKQTFIYIFTQIGDNFISKANSDNIKVDVHHIGKQQSNFPQFSVSNKLSKFSLPK